MLCASIQEMFSFILHHALDIGDKCWPDKILGLNINLTVHVYLPTDWLTWLKVRPIELQIGVAAYCFQ